MKKKLCLVISCLIFALALTGCYQNDAGQLLEGEVGEPMPSYFFTFTVDSAEIITRDDYTPEEGNVLLGVTITTTNTFQEAYDMYYVDYQLQWGERSAESENFAIVLEPLDETCAPITHPLGIDESMTFLYIYEAPADVSDFSVCHLEEFIDPSGNQKFGDIHYVNFSV